MQHLRRPPLLAALIPSPRARIVAVWSAAMQRRTQPCTLGDCRNVANPAPLPRLRGPFPDWRAETAVPVFGANTRSATPQSRQQAQDEALLATAISSVEFPIWGPVMGQSSRYMTRAST